LARIELWNGDICDLEVDAIVNAANLSLWMSTGVGGEIKRASSVRSNMYAIVGAAVAATVVMALTAALLQSKVGNEFLYSSGSLFYAGTSPLPVAPFFGFLLALVPGSTFFIWVAFSFNSFMLYLYTNQLKLLLGQGRVTDDTAGSVAEVMKRRDASRAAIAGRRAAEVYGASIIRESIQDQPENFTRFVLLSAKGNKS